MAVREGTGELSPGHGDAAKTLASRLAGFPSFASVPVAVSEAVARLGRVRHLEAGDWLLREGDATPFLYVVLSGRAKMTRQTARGVTALLALFGPGEIVGAVPALSAESSHSSVQALEAVEVLAVPCSELLALLRERTELLGPIVALLTHQLVECKNCLVEAISGRVEVRFAHLFSKLADEVGQPVANGTWVPIRLSRQELADMTGTTIESAIRLMSRWQKEGVLLTERDGFLVHDPAALRRHLE